MCAAPNRMPQKLELQVQSQFKASHSLAGFEVPHFHVWKVTLGFSSVFPILNDRLIDLVFLGAQLQEILGPVEGKYLNTWFDFSPTSENVASWLWSQVQGKLPQAPLASVTISLCDLEGKPTGQVTLS